jgi:Putative MetA-pathway of phenol degradation
MRVTLRALTGVGFLLASGAWATAFGQYATQPDKSQYTLFDPVPDDQLRDFDTDRPPKAYVPYTVDAGRFQYETDIVNFANLVTGSTHIDTLLVPNPTFKFGLTNNAELQLSAAAIVGVHTFNIAAGMSSAVWGLGDTFVRTKFNIWGNDGGNSAFALVPYVKAPTAPPGIGDGAVEEGLIAPLSFSLPNGFTLLFNSEIDALKNSADDARHANYINVVNLSHLLVKDLTLYVELWSDYNDDPTLRTQQYTFDLAVAWVVRPNLQLDFGLDFGLNGAAPVVQVFAGISQRF